MSASPLVSVIRPPLLLMAGIEAIILFSSIYVAGILTFGSLQACESILGPLAPKAAIGTAVVLVSLVAVGLYQFHERMYYREAIVRVLVGIAAGGFVFAAIIYAIPAATITPKVAMIASGYSLIFLVLARYLYLKTLDENIFRRRTLIYGAGTRAASIDDLRRRADRRGFRIVGRIASQGDANESGPGLIATEGKSIADIAVEVDADEIVVAMDDRRGNLPTDEFLEARLRGIEIIDLLEFLERETDKIRIDVVKPGWLIFSSGFRVSRFSRLTKRLVDIVVSTVLLLLLWPVMLAIAIAIKIEDGWAAPVIYLQKRVGRSDQIFSVIKFRSMIEDAEADGQPVWAAENDSRITGVGSWLRTWRLDELPQIINVIRGQMSLVGPRPERPEFVTQLQSSIPYYSERHTIKPGITGWAQIKYAYGSSENDAVQKLQYDLYYVKNHSVLLDIIIILQTVEIVLWGKGAH